MTQFAMLEAHTAAQLPLGPSRYPLACEHVQPLPAYSSLAQKAWHNSCEKTEPIRAIPQAELL